MISIVVPTYNESKNINKFIKRLFKLKYKYELIFVDDNSSDDTLKKVKNFFLKILNAFGYKFTPQSEIIKNTNNFKLNKISRPKFIFLKIKRIMFFERVLRLLDIN